MDPRSEPDSTPWVGVGCKGVGQKREKERIWGLLRLENGRSSEAKRSLSDDVLDAAMELLWRGASPLDKVATSSSDAAPKMKSTLSTFQRRFQILSSPSISRDISL